jgi:hypothetical protein
MAKRKHIMAHKREILFEMIDLLMTIFDCINIHQSHSRVTNWICDLLSTIHESTSPTVAVAVAPPCRDIGEEATGPTECLIYDFGTSASSLLFSSHILV